VRWFLYWNCLRRCCLYWRSFFLCGRNRKLFLFLFYRKLNLGGCRYGIWYLGSGRNPILHSLHLAFPAGSESS
jgi:hypothetical protein